jgi:hypothetical protein
MPGILGTLKANIAYAFIAVGIVWLGVAYLVGPLVLWPVATCIIAGLLIKLRGGTRLAWAWATSSAVLGLVLSGYAAYVDALLITGPFSTIASVSLAGFGVLALVHLILLYAVYSPKKAA